MAGDWIKGAVKRPGALRAKARKAGMSTQAYARAHDKGNSRTAKQARLAETFSRMNHRKSKRR